MGTGDEPTLEGIVSRSSAIRDPAWRRPPGKIAIRIDRDGRWFYRGTPIERESMVRLFASMLRPADGHFVLDTPDQVLRIEVDDAPLVIVDADIENPGTTQLVWLQTSLGERFHLCTEHPLIIRGNSGDSERRAYSIAGHALPALIHRNVFYRLAALAEFDVDSGRHGIRSAGDFFALE